MTFIELVEKVSTQTGIPKSKVKQVLHATGVIIDSHLRAFLGREVKWYGFGRFTPRKTRAGKAFGRPLIPRTVVKFTPYGH